ncbi:MAG: AAA family ATPase [Syntrophobacterales bacterium]|nr:AAA family ATPase [Syntrophobacterales bacterium]
MKIAVSGKGGVGKTTLAAFISRWLGRRGFSVLAIDADPDSNLANALGCPQVDSITPIAEMKDLIYERTEAMPGSFGGLFKMNPKVDDLPDKIAIPCGDNVRLMVMGGVKKGGMGCVCPESVLLKNLVHHLVIRRGEAVIMDMEAGIEHLGRGTARGVTAFIVVVEPGKRSIETAYRIRELAKDMGLEKIFIVGNKIRSERDKGFISERLVDFLFLGFIPYDEALIEADIRGAFPDNVSSETMTAFEAIGESLLRLNQEKE